MTDEQTRVNTIAALLYAQAEHDPKRTNEDYRNLAREIIADDPLTAKYNQLLTDNAALKEERDNYKFLYKALIEASRDLNESQRKELTDNAALKDSLVNKQDFIDLQTEEMGVLLSEFSALDKQLTATKAELEQVKTQLIAKRIDETDPGKLSALREATEKLYNALAAPAPDGEQKEG